MTAPLGDLAAIRTILRGSRDEQGTAQAGPCVATLNLIVFIDDVQYRDWVAERAAGFAGKHPSRLIIFDATRSGGAAEVSTTRGDGCTVLSQRVDLAVGDAPPALVGRVAQDLRVPDTPTVLWWSSARVKDVPALEALFEAVDTMVIDSSGPNRPDESVRDIASFLAAHPGAIVRDLAYLRLAPWQDMIAQFFDDPALFQDLFSLRRLEIAAGSEAESVYLAGWLASRLSWTVRDRRTFVARDGRPVLFATSREGERRRVVRVVLGTDDTTYAATLSDDPTVACLSVEGKRAKPSSYTPLQSIDTMSLVERATVESGRDPIFEATVETVCALFDCAPS